MPQYKTVISFVFFLLFFSCCNAQDSNKYVYQDSTQTTADSSNTATNTLVLPDTVIRFNNLAISPDSITSIKNLKEFAYAKNLDSLLMALKKKNEVQSDIADNKSDWLKNLLASVVTKVLLWSLAGLFITFVLYKLFFIEGSFLRNNARNKVSELNEDTAGTHLYDYDKLIAKAINEKNYRLGVRYLYLQSLQQLAENNLVKLEAEKTNYEYINELNNSIYKDDFLWLTLNYEYVWYGEFDLDEENFYTLRNRFGQFNNLLQRN